MVLDFSQESHAVQSSSSLIASLEIDICWVVKAVV